VQGIEGRGIKEEENNRDATQSWGLWGFQFIGEGGKRWRGMEGRGRDNHHASIPTWVTADVREGRGREGEGGSTKEEERTPISVSAKRRGQHLRGWRGRGGEEEVMGCWAWETEERRFGMFWVWPKAWEDAYLWLVRKNWVTGLVTRGLLVCGLWSRGEKVKSPLSKENKVRAVMGWYGLPNLRYI
jgi:hypothetical protein